MITKEIRKVVLILIAIQLILFCNLIFADDYCLLAENGISIAQNVGSQNNEYVVLLNSHQITDKNIVIKKVDTFNDLPNCLNKTLVLQISDNTTFKLTNTNKYMEISGDLDILRFKDDEDPSTKIDINFFVDNNETQLELYNNSGPGELNIKVPKIEFINSTRIIANERVREVIDISDINDNKRLGYGVKLKLKDIEIRENADVNLLLAATKPKDRQDPINNTFHGMHGGNAELIMDDLNNYGNLDIKIIAANGSVGSDAQDKKNKDGGVGGNGGNATLVIKDIFNYSNNSLSITSGNGGNGGQGSKEGEWPCIGTSPKKGGDAGLAGDLNLSINMINNFSDSNINFNLIGGNGGNGGDAGKDYCLRDDTSGGIGGNGSNIYLKNTTTHTNNGNYALNIFGGAGGKGGSSIYKSNPVDDFGTSGFGGSIYNWQISKLINTSNYSHYAKSGKININDFAIEKKKISEARGFATAGSITDLTIGHLVNNQFMDIVLELNEDNENYLNSAACNCEVNCNLPQYSQDPILGNININYLASGSFLPRTAKIIKEVPIADTKINISGCYMQSIGNSQINYISDILNIEGTNLADIANDFNESGSKIGLVNPFNRYCPVCDGVELNNFSLRTDKEYTIYTDISSGDIIDLNIYYLNPDGNIFSPPGFPQNQDYVIYSLASGKAIEPIENIQFPGTGIKEYKITKELLHYNPEGFDLEQLDGTPQSPKDFTTDDVRLFCQGQRYRLKFRLFNNTTKTIDFTPISNIN